MQKSYSWYAPGSPPSVIQFRVTIDAIRYAGKWALMVCFCFDSDAAPMAHVILVGGADIITCVVCINVIMTRVRAGHRDGRR